MALPVQGSSLAAALHRDEAENAENEAMQSNLLLREEIGSMREELRSVRSGRSSSRSVPMTPKPRADGKASSPSSLVCRDSQQRSHMDRLQQSQMDPSLHLGTLRRDLAAASRRLAETRAEQGRSEEACVAEKGQLFEELGKFRRAALAFAPGNDLDCAALQSDLTCPDRQHEVLDLTALIGSLAELMDDSGFLEFRKLQDESASFCLRQKDMEWQLAEARSKARELEAHAHSDLEHLRGVEKQGRNELLSRLRSEESSCQQVRGKITLASRRYESICNAEGAQREGLARNVSAAESEVQALAERLMAVQDEVVHARHALRPREVFFDQLQQQDATTWSLNAQLAASWREEASASRQEQDGRLSVARLRTELEDEASAIARLEAVEASFRNEADEASALIANATVIASPTPSVMAVEDVQGMLLGLASVREQLREENTQWRLEMEKVREAARPAPSTSFPRELQESSPRAVKSSSSGYHRALLAWDSVLGSQCADHGSAQSRSYRPLMSVQK
mmetsp:Transcript_35829/g.78438  ORF Transcript_35829/g.78438 Transcript_35829/m.78438 type:complete len:512 (-) Transcript_35829:4-1539(-)